jgi:hypothetical protein
MGGAGERDRGNAVVPRRKTPLAPKGQLLFLDYAAALHAGDMAGIIAAVRACSATRNLPQSLKHTLLFDLGGTVVFAKIGVRPWLSGRTVKPDAWNRDILVRGAFDAGRRAGLSPTVRDDPKGKSEFLRFCEDLSGDVSLLTNAKRSKEIRRWKLVSEGVTEHWESD